MNCLPSLRTFVGLIFIVSTRRQADQEELSTMSLVCLSCLHGSLTCHLLNRALAKLGGRGFTRRQLKKTPDSRSLQTSSSGSIHGFRARKSPVAWASPYATDARGHNIPFTTTTHNLPPSPTPTQNLSPPQNATHHALATSITRHHRRHGAATADSNAAARPFALVRQSPIHHHHCPTVKISRYFEFYDDTKRSAFERLTSSPGTLGV